ncbi:hypothetical protein ABPG72_012235 [Tetrahymena utriculariae]
MYSSLQQQPNNYGGYSDYQNRPIPDINWSKDNQQAVKANYAASRSSKDDQSSTSTRNQSRKTVDDYTFLDQKDKKAFLGQGSYGTVRLAIDKSDGQKYAIKMMHKSTIFQYCTIDNLKREIKIQKRMNHPNICKLYHYFEDKQYVYLVLEYAEQGSLFHNLRKVKKFSEELAFRFFYQTCLGIDHLHKNSIIHRDLKPENLLIDGKGDIKLCDFGWSAEQRNSIVRKTFCGTVDYMPPEMIENQPHDQRVDIWCLGILLYELIHGYAPFLGHDDQTKLKNIRNRQEIVFEPFVPKDLEELIRGILQHNPLHRLSMDDIFRHRWMVKFYKRTGINIDEVLKQQNQNTLGSRSLQTKHIVADQPSINSVNDSIASSNDRSFQKMQTFPKNQYQTSMYYSQNSNQNMYPRYMDSNSMYYAPSQPIQNQQNTAEKQTKEESFLDRFLIAFGCMTRDKNKN